ncbi:serine/threonine protein kinase [Sclerotinia borealis F-4128]|uniref:Serine/threonine protein kinase n=1 Tax=Sclerotinia borealis (strain F-4128) TaxID=1432307 RepID=W9C4P5_SCLBF|nr:serine/threonine protein kinase [Sclerotinia borealis F-4128]
MSTTSTSSSVSEDPLIRFAPVLAAVSHSSLTALAQRIRRQLEQSQKSSSNQTDHQENEADILHYGCTVLPTAIYGSYNVLKIIEFSDGLRWIVRILSTGLKGQYTAESSTSLKSDALTMRFIKANTTMPVPEIYDFSATTENDVGAPYILMSFLDGVPVYEVWFDESGEVPKEIRREQILDTIAEAMSQLKKFHFDQIGSLQFDTNLNPTRIGKCNLVDEYGVLDNLNNETDEGPKFLQIGPFSSSYDYFGALFDTQRLPKDSFTIGIHKLLRMMIQCIPPSVPSKESADVHPLLETFVLAHPDAGSQNFLVSKDGVLTGIIDWDGVHTEPHCIGYQRYPSWITRDWDPAMYGYLQSGCQPKDSPEALEGYRQRYSKIMQLFVPEYIDYISKSHIFEALQIALSSPVCRDNIVVKFFCQLFPKEDQEEAEHPMYLYETAVGIAEDRLDESAKARIIDAIVHFFKL